MPPPRVSVVLATYNCERYIRETVESVLAQTYRDYEFIVVDDASTDGTVALLQQYGPRLKLKVREVNSHMCGLTKNQGVEMATGEYIAFIDADDTWHARKLEQQVAFMDAHPEIPLSHTYCEVMDPASRTTRIRHEGRLPPTGSIFAQLLPHCFITICTVMIRRALVDEMGCFRTDPVFGPASEDHEFFLRVARRHPIGLVPEVLARYRRGIPGSMAMIKGWDSTPEVYPFQKLLLHHPELWVGTVSRRVITDSFLWVCGENALFWQDQGFPARALFFAWEALKVRPCARGAWDRLLRAAVRLLWPHPRRKKQG